MSKEITIGDNISFSSDEIKNLTLSFSPVDITNWGKKADKLAHLIADYYRLYINDECAALISTVLNELIENAIKYSHKKTDSVTIDTLRNEDKLLIKITNTIAAEKLNPFINECKKLFEEDLKKLFINRIESLKNKNGNQTSGGIGLILLKKDYNTGIKFIFYENKNENYTVSVIAELNIE
ncbi:MAG TPA: DUF6272 family protein [Spirochaetota bacterium]|nr:DUF6272 family protein [Spirochaetota bacterium]